MDGKPRNGIIPRLVRRFVNYYRCTEINCHSNWDSASENGPITMATCPNCGADVPLSRVVSFMFAFVLVKSAESQSI